MLKKPKIFNIPEFEVFKKLNTPAKVQDFIDKIPVNFSITCRSPLSVLRKNRAYCIEAAFLAAAIFWYHGRRPLVFVLQTAKRDFDHVLALFRENGRWGAISKTNHPVLRYREPVYKSIRELAMSYFHEYFMDDGKKTMRGYSEPIDLRKFGTDWIVSKEDIWRLDSALAKAKYHKILGRKQIPLLRNADKIEIKATKLVQWKRT
ncbi:MAG TPA: hypothetical protein VNK70_02490 [Candidatus Paceibacterota bacterium]|nr:hypothetical protein [Candidatus Paceibacterota bacterium]